MTLQYHKSIITRHQVLRSMTSYPPYIVSPELVIHNIKKWKLFTFQDYLYNSWVIDPPIMWSNDILYLTKSICQIPLKELLQAHRFHDHMSLRSPKEAHCLKVHEISWYLYWENLLLLASINSDPIYMKYMISLPPHL